MEQNGRQQYINTDQGDRIKWLETHYSKFNNELGTVQADVKWLKWYMKLVIGGQVALIVAIIGLLLK